MRGIWNLTAVIFLIIGVTRTLVTFQVDGLSLLAPIGVAMILADAYWDRHTQQP